MRQIWKFELTDLPDPATSGSTQVPKGAEFRSCQVQGGSICIWASVNPHETQMEWWRWILCGTGDNFKPLKATYFATVQDGSHVWHLFWGDSQ